MSEIKILVTKMPKHPKDCPFRNWNCEYGYLCSLPGDPFKCEIHKGRPCDKLVAPLTFDNEEASSEISEL